MVRTGADSRGRCAQMRAALVRLTNTARAAAALVAAEMCRLNRIGADQGSRIERVRAAKAALAGRGEGPRRCC